MDYYFEIRVLPDPEFTETTLLNAAYSKLHRVLMDVGEGRLGVSFPNHDKTLGDTLRVHGLEQDLSSLRDQPWLKGLRDYTAVSPLAEVPAHREYRLVSRVQAKSAHNKRKRSITKGWLSEEEAFEQISDDQQKQLTLPYAQLRSLSNGSLMRIYVKHGELLDSPTKGKFSSYGLSKSATVPWF